MPLYNVQYNKDPNDIFTYTGEMSETIEDSYRDDLVKSAIQTDNIAIEAANKAVKLSLFADSLTLDEQYTTIDSDNYYKRYNTLNNDSIYSNEYYPFYEVSNIEKLITLSGNDHSIKSIVGKYYIDNDNNVRTIFNPSQIIKSNIDNIYHSNFYLFYLNGVYYPVHFIIYTTTDDVNNIKLYYNNKYLTSIANNGIVDISLNSIFNSNQLDIKSDFENLNNNYFIVQTLFTIGVFLNKEDGIYRYIPFEFTKKFFDIVFNKIKLEHDGLFHLYNGAKSKNLIETRYSSKYYQIKTYKEYTDGFKDSMPIAIETNSIKDLLQDRKSISQNTLKNIDNLYNFSTLTSNANYFNDLIFDLAKSGETLTIPVMLVNG